MYFGMQPFIHIRSAKFPIVAGETEELVKEGTYGKAFAQFLETRLKERGYHVPFICCEDWGWWVEIKGQPFSLGCCVYGASNANEGHELCVAVSREAGRQWSWGRFRFVDTTGRVNQLYDDLRSMLANDPDIEILGEPEAFPLD
jgi:hypothetical protein